MFLRLLRAKAVDLSLRKINRLTYGNITYHRRCAGRAEERLVNIKLVQDDYQRLMNTKVRKINVNENE